MAMSHMQNTDKACSVSIGKVEAYSSGFNENVSSVCQAPGVLYKLSNNKHDVGNVK